MADNVAITAGTGTTIASDDVGLGVQVQRVKLIHGVDGTNDGDVAKTNGFPVQGAQAAVTTVAWTSATSLNTASSISVIGYNTVSVAMSNTSTMTGGVLTFEVSPDNTNWFPIAMSRVDSYTVETTYTLSTVANRAWSTSVDAFTNFRVRLSTVISGTGTASVFIIPQAFAIEPIVSVGQATAANLNATVTATNLSSNVAQINGVTPLMGNGVTGTGSPRVTIASDTSSNTNPFLIRGAATTTSSGALIAKVLSAANTTPISVKTSAAQIYGWQLINNATSTRYVRVYNVSSSPTMGTTSPTFVLPLPASGGAVFPLNDLGIPMGTGFFYAVTTGAADLDNTAGAANDVVGTFWYI